MIRWMAGHPVAANLLMTLILVGGAVSVFNVKQEIFPEFELDRVNVSVAYAGATPEELEEPVVAASTSTASCGPFSVVVSSIDKQTTDC